MCENTPVRRRSRPIVSTWLMVLILRTLRLILCCPYCADTTHNCTPLPAKAGKEAFATALLESPGR